MEHHATATFEGNYWASDDGGALFIVDYSKIIIDGNSVLKLHDNEDNKGGALYITHYSHVALKRKLYFNKLYTHICMYVYG